MWKMVLTVLLLFASVIPARALEVGGTNLPETMPAGDFSLLLNGAGIRKKSFLRIKVYAGGLYLSRKSSDSSAIVDDNIPMAVKMIFIYDGVSAKKLINAWNEGFAASGSAAAIPDEIKKFNSFFTEEAKRGDIYDLVYLPGEGVTVSRNGVVRGTVEGLAFKKALFSIWLGERPADSGLKKKMLGG